MNYYSKSKQDVLAELNTTAKGLTQDEAQKRIDEYGKNELEEGKKKTLIGRFFSQFKNVMIIVLIVAAVVSSVLAIISGQKTGDYTDLIDAGIILFIVILNAVIGTVQEVKADNSLEALRNMNKPLCKVYRNGELVKIESEFIVKGDIVVLEAGDCVPADLRLIETASLKVEESALTGESVPVDKDCDAIVDDNAPIGDRINMAYSSGVVSYGRGVGVVVETGMNTEVGKIAGMLTVPDQTTPLQKQLSKTAKIISILVLGIAFVIFAVSLVRGIIKDKDNILGEVLTCFMTAVAIAVAAIPEGLPAVVTIVLALGVQRMSKKNAIVRNLPAVETLGSCEIICSDKTGTLTLNRMTVKGLYTLGNTMGVDNIIKTPDTDLLVKGLMLCNDSEKTAEGLFGDPTETALVVFGEEYGFDYFKLCEENKRFDEIPFDSVRKLMTTYNDCQGKKTVFVKGAPDILLSRCTKILDNGNIRDITKADFDDIEKANLSFGEKALRVLGTAMTYDIEKGKDSIENELIFVGLVGMIDPPREEVKASVQRCFTAGIRPIMITGDHMVTAAAIAREIGIMREGDKVASGAMIDAMDDEEFYAHVAEYSVFARVSPENKVRIVKAYQLKGCVVAMTGDGVNDAPAIKNADIGIGMGITGTDVSKGAADMILADDNFVTIVSAVEEGRKIYTNISKAVQFLFSANIAEVLCLFISTIILSSIVGQNIVFLSPVMILWINLITDTLPALALGVEKAEKNIMDNPPRKRGKSLFSGKTGKDIIIQGIMQTALCLLSFCIGYFVFDAPVVGSTMVFITLSLIQLFHSYNLRSINNSIFHKDLLSNKLLNISFIVGAVLVIAVVLIPGLNGWFGVTSLNWQQWLIAIFSAIAIVPIVEIQKLIENKLAKKEK